MKLSTFIVPALAICLAFSTYRLTDYSSSQLDTVPEHIQVAFSNWKMSEGRLYSSPSEQEYRLRVFYEIFKEIKEVNAQQDSYKLGLNEFSDMTLEEFQTKYTGATDFEDDIDSLEAPEDTPADQVDPLDAPATHDWVAKGAFSPITHQKSCGSCWAFASTAALEAAVFIKTNKRVKLSEQVVIDCDTSANGCNGGGMALKYLTSKGTTTLSRVGYLARKGTCKSTHLSSQVYKASKNTGRKANLSVASMKSYIYTAPGFVTVYVDSKFKSYKSGILVNRVSATKNNHAVAGVGYGSNYIKIRNSWNTKWGESGYGRMDIAKSGTYGANNILMRYGGFTY